MIERQKAFTLIELLVVISIIALLSSVVLASLNAAREKARIAGARQFDGSLYRVAASDATALYEFDECSGTSVGDRSGNGTSGSTAGSPSWSSDTPSGIGCSISLNGSSQYVDLGNTSVFDLSTTESFSVSAWVKPTSASGYMRVFNTGHSGWTNGFLLHSSTAWGTGGPGTGIGSGSIGTSIYVQALAPLAPGRWTHLAAVYDQTAKVVRLYVDGQISPLSKYPGSCGTLTSAGLDYSTCSPNMTHTTNTNIGRSAGGSEYFNGLIDSLRFFEKTLTAKEVRDIHASESIGNETAFKN